MARENLGMRVSSQEYEPDMSKILVVPSFAMMIPY